MSRISCPVLAAKVAKAEEAVAYIHHGDNVGFSRKRILALAGKLKPSFLLDVESGGANELEILSGAVSRFGRESGIPTPATSRLSPPRSRRP